jgi:hypothetical protein
VVLKWRDGAKGNRAGGRWTPAGAKMMSGATVPILAVTPIESYLVFNNYRVTDVVVVKDTVCPSAFRQLPVAVRLNRCTVVGTVIRITFATWPPAPTLP